MTESTDPLDPDADIEIDIGHPKGTLAIVLVYGALFALGWVLLYLGAFMPRGIPQP